MSAYPTGDAAIDALPVEIASITGDFAATVTGATASSVAKRMAQALLFLVTEACDNGTAFRPGFVLSTPKPAVVGTNVLAVSPDVLAVLGYDDIEAYQAALDTGEFIHESDQQSSVAHVEHGLAAPYNLRLLRGDGSGNYTRCNVRGLTIGMLGKQYRITIIRRQQP